MSDATVATGKKRLGRPPKGDAPLSKTERDREYRHRHALVAVRMNKEVRELLARARTATGLSNMDILRTALRQYAA